jgi:hypothetical protein
VLDKSAIRHALRSDFFPRARERKRERERERERERDLNSLERRRPPWLVPFANFRRDIHYA